MVANVFILSFRGCFLWIGVLLWWAYQASKGTLPCNSIYHTSLFLLQAPKYVDLVSQSLHFYLLSDFHNPLVSALHLLGIVSSLFLILHHEHFKKTAKHRIIVFPSHKNTKKKILTPFILRIIQLFMNRLWICLFRYKRRSRSFKCCSGFLCSSNNLLVRCFFVELKAQTFDLSCVNFLKPLLRFLLTVTEYLIISKQQFFYAAFVKFIIVFLLEIQCKRKCISRYPEHLRIYWYLQDFILTILFHIC